MTHWTHVQMLPEEFFHLQRELVHHPTLQELLNNHPPEEWELRMAEIAAYCSVILDDVYTPEDIGKLAGILTKKLYNMRPAGTIVVLS